MFICAGAMESFPFAKSVGVGSINVAINLTRLALQESPKTLIFIGSAGAYDKTHDILSIIESNIAAHIELSMTEGKSYTPLDNVIEVTWENAPTRHIVNSSNYITTHEESATWFLKHGIAYENMEFFSVLSVAQAFKIPAKGIFCITNHTNANAHSDFLHNTKPAIQKLTQHIRTHYAQYL